MNRKKIKKILHIILDKIISNHLAKFLQDRIHLNNVTFNETATNIFTILKNYFLPNLNPTSYLR